MKTVIGTIEEFDKVYLLASNADIVLNVASSENIPFIQGILAGQRQYFNTLGAKPILIHTSCSALVLQNVQGPQQDSYIVDVCGGFRSEPMLTFP